jgi:hypothetical protein
MNKMEIFAESTKMAHILKVWTLLSTKITSTSKSVEVLSVMTHSRATPLVYANLALTFFFKVVSHWKISVFR